MVRVVYHDDLKEVQADAQLAALLAAPQARAPFDRIEWWQGLVEVCDLFPLIAVAKAGRERAVMPLLRRGRQVHCLANWYSFRVAPLFTPDADRTALIDAWAQQRGEEHQTYRHIAEMAPRERLSKMIATLVTQNIVGEASRIGFGSALATIMLLMPVVWRR